MLSNFVCFVSAPERQKSLLLCHLSALKIFFHCVVCGLFWTHPQRDTLHRLTFRFTPCHTNQGAVVITTPLSHTASFFRVLAAIPGQGMFFSADCAARRVMQHTTMMLMSAYFSRYTKALHFCPSTITTSHKMSETGTHLCQSFQKVHNHLIFHASIITQSC